MDNLTFPLWAICAAAAAAAALLVAALATAGARKGALSGTGGGGLGLVGRAGDALEKAGIGMDPSVYVLVRTMLPAAGAAACWALGTGPAAAIAAAAAGALLPSVALSAIAKSRMKRRDEDLAKALDQMASALRANASLTNAVADVGRNKYIERRTRADFAGIAAEIRVGTPVDEAFRMYADESGNPYARELAAAVAIQVQVGHHEDEAVQSIADSIHREIALRKDLDSAFADTTAMIAVMDFIPYAVIAMFLVGVREVSKYYFESPANTLILVALAALPATGSVISHALSRRARRAS